MSTLISSNVVSPFYIWWGQIVDEVNWIKNINPKNHARDDVPGWGPCRCKVRIFGRDTRTKDSVPDDQLEWAEVILPVTAGSGHAGSMQTPNLRQGSYVVGFYKDGINATQPIIFGTLPNNSQTRLFGGDPNGNFIPRTGYKGNTGDKPVSTKNIYSEGPSSTFYRESSDSNLNTVNQQDQQKDGARCHHVPKTRACDGPSGELKGIQRFIKNALAFINRIKAEAGSFMGAATDIAGQISAIVDETAIFVSNLMKSLLDKMRGYVVNKLNNGVKDLIDKLPPNQTPAANQANEKATDILQCVFNKIIKGLLALIKKLLEEIIDKYINAPMCAIEKFVGDILSNILGDITAGIKSAMAAVQGILGKIGDVVGQVFDALNILIGILKFLSCDEELDCTMGDEWSFWGGAKCVTENVRANIGSYYKDALSKIGPSNAPPCNTTAIPCGPPKLSITGGGGSGALGNPIISAAGSILGIDFKSGGSGYVSSPNISVIDDCGKGSGATLVPIIGRKKPPVIGGTPGTALTAGGTPVTAGGTGGTPVTAGGTGGTPVTVGGTPVTAGGTGGTPVTLGGTPVTAGGTPVTVGGVDIVASVGDVPINVGTNVPNQTLITDDGSTLGIGGSSGTPVLYGGLEVISNGNPLVANSSGGNDVYVGGDGQPFTTPDGEQVLIGAIGGNPVTINDIPITIGGIPITVGGTGGTPITSGTIDFGGSIVGSVVLDPGAGYISSPDGDLGGNGSVWAPKDSTIVERNDGTIDAPYNPGSSIDVNPGDIVTYPGKSPFPVRESQTITAPPYEVIPSERGIDPSTSNGSYPVVLTIVDTLVTNPGISYLPTDKIMITPDNGAILEPIFNDNGSLSGVSVVNGGIGFTDFPTITIESLQGINAKITPIFGITRIGDLTEEEQNLIPQGTGIINVVDCVGRIL